MKLTIVLALLGVVLLNVVGVQCQSNSEEDDFYEWDSDILECFNISLPRRPPRAVKMGLRALKGVFKKCGTTAFNISIPERTRRRRRQKRSPAKFAPANQRSERLFGDGARNFFTNIRQSFCNLLTTLFGGNNPSVPPTSGGGDGGFIPDQDGEFIPDAGDIPVNDGDFERIRQGVQGDRLFGAFANICGDDALELKAAKLLERMEQQKNPKSQKQSDGSGGIFKRFIDIFCTLRNNINNRRSGGGSPNDIPDGAEVFQSMIDGETSQQLQQNAQIVSWICPASGQLSRPKREAQRRRGGRRGGRRNRNSPKALAIKLLKDTIKNATEALELPANCEEAKESIEGLLLLDPSLVNDEQLSDFLTCIPNEIGLTNEDGTVNTVEVSQFFQMVTGGNAESILATIDEGCSTAEATATWAAFKECLLGQCTDLPKECLNANA